MQLAGLYLRLSREDDEREHLSQSIQNQQDFLLGYCSQNRIPVVNTYIDDGYSGTNFNRPAFLRLLEDIEEKRINLVLTKDLSRLGRDYILTGHYLERYFPEHGVRYIAVNDHIDTGLEQSGSDLTPFRAVFNDLYARDISKKVRTALKTKRENGKFIGTFAPFGYRKDPRDKNHLLIDEKQADTVRQIYGMFLSGESICGIAARLTGFGVPTPSASRNAGTGAKKWSYAMVRRILSLETYKGDLVSSMTRKISYKVDRVVHLPREEWLVVAGTHEGIVAPEEFEQARKMLSIRSYTRRTGGGEEDEKPLTGLIFCADCGAPMVLWSNGKCRYFVCSQWKRGRSCTAHYIREDALTQAVRYRLEQLTRRADRAVLTCAPFPPDRARGPAQRRLEKNRAEQASIRQTLLALYRDRVSGAVSLSDYELLSEQLHRDREALLQQEAVLQGELSEQDASCRERFAARLTQEGMFDRALTRRLINRIVVGADKSLSLYLKCRRPAGEAEP